MRAALYARVSTTDQTCENQLRELREYAVRRGVEAVEFVEHGVSGAKRSRPALDALLVQLRQRRFDVLVVWSMDRLSRSAAHAAALIEELTELGVTIVAMKQGLDTSTVTGRAFAQMSGIFAEIERENITRARESWPREGEGERQAARSRAGSD
jgi:DNA invertase Pin-like site-specific DNA recombinase